MEMDSHVLRGTFHVSHAKDAASKAIEAASEYFGEIPVCIDLNVSEVRDLGDRVMTYEVDYVATPRQEMQWVEGDPVDSGRPVWLRRGERINPLSRSR